MHADLKGALEKVLSKRTAYKMFSHKDSPMTKGEVIAVLKYGIHKGYDTTEDISEKEVDSVLKELNKK